MRARTRSYFSRAARPQWPLAFVTSKRMMIGRTMLRQNECNLSLFSAEHAEALAARDETAAPFSKGTVEVKTKPPQSIVSPHFKR